MKNAAQWRPTKYVRQGDRLRASRDPREVSVGSRLLADAIAALYDAHIPMFCRGRLVDLGCGKAPLYGTYRRHVDEVVCVDWAASPHATEHLDVVCDLGEALPFEDARFDTVILSDVLEHVPAPERLWSELRRIVAPGGHVILSVPFYYWVHEEPHDYYRYTEFALRRFAETHGFDTVELRTIGGSPLVLGDFLGKHLAAVPAIGALLASSVHALVTLSMRVRSVERAAASTARKFPIEYFMVARRSDEVER